MIVKGTRQLGSFKRGIDLYTPKKQASGPPPTPPITVTTAFDSIGNVIATNTGDIPNIWVPSSNVASVTFANDNSVTTIGISAFSNNQLTSVTIPNSVTSIGSGAFSNNQLTSVTIPNSLTNIGGSAFSNNYLTSVTIGNSVTTIGSYAFYNNSLTSVTIPNSVTSIGSYAFYSNQLASVTIPDSVTSIGSYVFSYNYDLSTVDCYTTQTAFVGSNAFSSTASPLTIHARATDGTWTAGTELSFQGNNNVTVIKDL